MKTAVKLFHYLKKQGTNRLRPLLILLKDQKDEYMTVTDLCALHQEKFHDTLEPWDLYLPHKDKLIEFTELSETAWEYIGDFVLGRLFDIKEDTKFLFQNDSVRITSDHFTELKNVEDYLLYRSLFSTMKRPLILHKNPMHQPPEELLNVMLPLYRYYGLDYTLDISRLKRLLNIVFFGSWQDPLKDSQIMKACNILKDKKESVIKISFIDTNLVNLQFSK